MRQKIEVWRVKCDKCGIYLYSEGDDFDCYSVFETEDEIEGDDWKSEIYLNAKGNVFRADFCPDCDYSAELDKFTGDMTFEEATKWIQEGKLKDGGDKV